MAVLSSLAHRLQKSEAPELAYHGPKLICNHLAENLAYLLTREQEPLILGHGDYLKSASTLKRILHDNIGDVIQVSDLCRLTGKSERTLERVCARAFASSPRALLKSHRLNSVRKALSDTGGKRFNVTYLALEYGFTHPGRFAGEYKKFFGELPSETLSRNRM